MKIEDKLKEIDSVQNLSKIIREVEEKLSELNEDLIFWDDTDNSLDSGLVKIIEDLAYKLKPYKELMRYLAYAGFGTAIFSVLKSQDINQANLTISLLSAIVLTMRKFIDTMTYHQLISKEKSHEIEYYQNISALLEEHANFLRNNPDYETKERFSSFSTMYDIRECWKAQKFYYRNKDLLEKKYRKGKLDKFLKNFCFYGDEREYIKEMTEEGMGQSRNLTREQNRYSN